jgi:hypothetical protein
MSFAVSVIGRILAGHFKNRDLVGTFGDDYRTYHSKVTMGVPRIGSRKWQCQRLPATSMAVAVPQYPVGHARHVLCLLGSGPVTDQRVKKHGTRAGRPTLKFLGFERENCGPL